MWVREPHSDRSIVEKEFDYIINHMVCVCLCAYVCARIEKNDTRIYEFMSYIWKFMFPSYFILLRHYQINMSIVGHQTFRRMWGNWNSCKEENHKYANII